MLDSAIENLHEAEVIDTADIFGKDGTCVKESSKNRPDRGIAVSYIVQGQLLPEAHGVLCPISYSWHYSFLLY